MKFSEVLNSLKLYEDLENFILEGNSLSKKKIYSLIETCHVKILEGEFDEGRALRSFIEAVEFGNKIFNEETGMALDYDSVQQLAEALLKEKVLLEEPSDAMILSAAKSQFPSPFVSIEYVNHQPIVLLKINGDEDFHKYLPNTYRVYDTGEFREPRLLVYITGKTIGVNLYALRGTETNATRLAQTDPLGQFPTNPMSNRLVGVLQTDLRVENLQNALKRLEGVGSGNNPV